ncbi:MAG: DUF2334 domain-containing protein [Anaerovorax sp.]|nr:DUF2334 domain-containing protein [Anaerovorax sp.]
MGKYIFRIDDIHPEMDWNNFFRLIDLFIKKGVKPLIGVIPDNKDQKICCNLFCNNFWSIISDLQKNGKLDIAMHGYQHLYATKDNGILGKFGMKCQSEFAGLPYEVQNAKIKKGKLILEEKGILTDIFMAPSHTFDKTTLIVLNENGFRYITDGIGLYPYRMYGITLVPQQMAWPRRVAFGVITICLHLNSVDDRFLKELENFISINRNNCCSFYNIDKGQMLLKDTINLFSRIALYVVYKIKRKNK